MARVALHVRDGLKEVVDPDDVYFLEALGGETKVRLRRARFIVDVREFAQVAPVFERHGFVRIHRSVCVNLERVRQIRRRPRGRDWEVKLEPPVNRVLPVSREAYPKLLARLGENG
jgi:DNA-binding LytR/AlgR family response regulator